MNIAHTFSLTGGREQHAADSVARCTDRDADDDCLPVGQSTAVPASANRRESLWHVVQPRQQFVQHELHPVLPVPCRGREQPVPLRAVVVMRVLCVHVWVLIEFPVNQAKFDVCI